MKTALKRAFGAAFLAFCTLARADVLLKTDSFSYTGSQINYNVPAGTDYIVVKGWGAGGGGGTSTSTGGGGAFGTASFNVASGEAFYVFVGGGGSGYLTGGAPGGGSASSLGGAGGGGYTRLSGAGVEFTIAGGGGGGNGSCKGGAGGTATGQNGIGPGTSYGGGGAQTYGGAAGNGDVYPGGAGGSYYGGNGNGQGVSGDGIFFGGGGGGGYFGGGSGGAGKVNGGGGGGGGSSYIGGNLRTSSWAGGSNATPGGATDPDYPGGGTGTGGNPIYGSGGNGYLVIWSYKIASPPSFTVQPPAQNLFTNQPSTLVVNAGGNPAATYSASGLPTGLSINSTTGAITGACSTAGTYNSTITATNSYGSPSVSVTWTIVYPTFNLSAVPATNPIYPGQTETFTATATVNSGLDHTQATVWYHNVGNGVVQPNGNGSDSYTFTIPNNTGLAAFQYRAIDQYGNFQDIGPNFTVAVPAVGAPTSFSTPLGASTFVSFTWSGATASYGVASYDVYRNGAFLINVTSASLTDNTVQPQTGYTYTIYTVDSHGTRSNVSTPVTVTTARTLEVFAPVL